MKPRCIAPVLDAKKRASLCGKPATTERTVEGVALPFCDDCAAAFDAKGKAKGGDHGAR
jgi:ribosome-binding protein aMBF1 (putative translation factor)